MPARNMYDISTSSRASVESMWKQRPLSLETWIGF